MTERRSPRALVLLCALLALATATLSLALLLEGDSSTNESGEEGSVIGNERDAPAGLEDALRRVRNLEAELAEVKDQERALLLERDRLEAVLASEASRVTELEILVDELDERLRGSDPPADSSRLERLPRENGDGFR
jgi:hypothetical protein